MDSPPYICILTTRSLSQGPIEVIDEAFRLPFLLPQSQVDAERVIPATNTSL